MKIKIYICLNSKIDNDLKKFYFYVMKSKKIKK